MRICVYGAGAIGGHMAARFAAAGEEVCLVARGPQLAALRADGLTFESGDQHQNFRLTVTAEPAELGVQDIVIAAVKANALDTIADGVRPLLGDHTKIVFAVNGLPWWYLDELRGTAADTPIRAAVARARIIGCVVNSANAVVAPGVVHNDLPTANNFFLGAAENGAEETVGAIAESLTRGGSYGIVSPDIRAEIWRKLQINTIIGPIACLTGAPGRQIAATPDLREMALAIAQEVQEAAAAWGITIALDADRFAPERLPAHKSSIMQDMEFGRPMEIDEVPGSAQAAARLRNVPTPVLDHCMALLRMRARLLGLYPH